MWLIIKAQALKKYGLRSKKFYFRHSGKPEHGNISLAGSDMVNPMWNIYK
jgi:hypothetical protein